MTVRTVRFRAPKGVSEVAGGSPPLSEGFSARRERGRVKWLDAERGLERTQLDPWIVAQPRGRDGGRNGG